ncbi:unnamed protein product, partial [Staurois parvus]
MISVAPAVPPVSVHQCLMSVLISASCQCPSELPFSVTHQCQSVPPINANQCTPISAANQCRLSVRISAAYQCLSVPPNSASQ